MQPGCAHCVPPRSPGGVHRYGFSHLWQLAHGAREAQIARPLQIAVSDGQGSSVANLSQHALHSVSGHVAQTQVLWEMMMEGNADQDGDNRISEDEFVRSCYCDFFSCVLHSGGLAPVTFREAPGAPRGLSGPDAVGCRYIRCHGVRTVPRQKHR